MRTFVTQFQVCPARYAFDQYGRNAPADSINTETCPGGFPADLRISVENSLRPFVSPTYFNLPVGISGGMDTMYGQVNINRKSALGFQNMIPVDVTQNSDAMYGAIGSKYLGASSPYATYGKSKYE